MTQLNFGRDVQGYNAYAPETSDLKYNSNLITSTETNIIVPSTFQNYIAAFAYQPGTTVWVDLTGATAVSPSSNSLTSCTAELNPGQRKVQAGDKISMITPNSTAQVGVILYAVT